MPGPINPIAEQQVGAVAYLFGITNNGTAISISGLVSFELDSDDLTLTWKEKENTDTTGNVQNITQTNFKYERSIKFAPSGSSRANAAAVAEYAVADSGGSFVPLQMISITVANYQVAAFNGLWRIKPGTKVNIKMDDNATVDLSCERYANATQNTNLNTVIVG